MLEELNQTLLEGMRLCRDRTVRSFGNTPMLEEKFDLDEKHSFAGSAMTQVDLDNQEVVLTHLYEKFPHVAISVEERLQNPSPIQELFYKNDGKSDILVQGDPLDGSFGFQKGMRQDYGMVWNVVERTGPDEGVYRSVIIYYPSLDIALVATEGKVAKVENSTCVELHQKGGMRRKQLYSAFFTHNCERLQLPGEHLFVGDLLSMAQAALQMVHEEIPGFITAQGHLVDHVAAAWLAKQWGADVAYANGKPFGIVRFGDYVTPQGRKTPRDENGLLIVGNRDDEMFSCYEQLYLPNNRA